MKLENAKILAILAPPYGGTLFNFRTQVKACLSQGANVKVVFINYTGNMLPLCVDGISEIIFDLPKLTKVIFAPALSAYIKPKIRMIIDDFSPDFIITYTDYLTLPIAEEASKRKIPVLAHINSVSRFRAKPIATRCYKKGLLLSWGVVFETRTARDDFFNYHGFEHQNVFVVPSPIDTEKFIPQSKPDDRHLGKNILAVGRLAPNKQFDLLLESFAIISEKLPDVTLNIVGDGPELPKLKKITKDLRLTEKVVFDGFQSDLVGIFNNSDLFIHASRYETFCRVIAEALSCEIPVVTCSQGGPVEILSGELSECIVEADATKIAEKALFFLQNAPHARKIAELGRMRIIEEYSSVLFEKRMAEIYCKIEE